MKLPCTLFLTVMPALAINPRRLRHASHVVAGYPVNLTDVDLLPEYFNGEILDDDDEAEDDDEAYQGDFMNSSTFQYSYDGYYGNITDDDPWEGYGENWTDFGFNETDFEFPGFGSFNPTRGSGLGHYLEELGLFTAINTSLVDLSCNVATPTCAHNARGDAGLWVCRSLYHPLDGTKIQWNACVNPAEKELKTDTCGCCSGKCEVACTCRCNLANGANGTGTWVSTVDFLDTLAVFDWLTPTQQEDMSLTKATVCVPEAVATSLVARPGNGITCVTQCPKV
jgi:hypothetical protein